MAKVTFNLTHNNNDEDVKSFTTLKSCVEYIFLTDKDWVNYTIDELENGEVVDSCSPCYFLETCKNLNNLPSSLHDC